MHLIDDADTVNARFVWKRSHKDTKKNSKALNQAWDVTKAIKHSNYGQAFKLLDAAVRSERTGDFAQDCDVLRNILIWNLRYRTIPSMLR